MTTSTAPATTYPAHSTAAKCGIVPGDWIVAGLTPDDAEIGMIVEISDDGETAIVAWDSGVRTPSAMQGAGIDVYARREWADDALHQRAFPEYGL
jgi:hypothetical protein